MTTGMGTIMDTGTTTGITTITVTVTDANGCTNVQTYEVQNKVATHDPIQDRLVSLAPVPVYGRLTIRSSGKSIIAVTLTRTLWFFSNSWISSRLSVPPSGP